MSWPSNSSLLLHCEPFPEQGSPVCIPVSAQFFVLKLHITPRLHPTLLQTHIPPAASPPDDLHACSKASPEGSRHCSEETGHAPVSVSPDSSLQAVTPTHAAKRTNVNNFFILSPILISKVCILLKQDEPYCAKHNRRAAEAVFAVNGTFAAKRPKRQGVSCNDSPPPQ